MVKRKAEISLDEWLTSGARAVDYNPAVDAANEEGTVISEGPTVEVQSGVKREPVAETHADVAGSEHDAAAWFWSLLESLGYELW